MKTIKQQLEELGFSPESNPKVFQLLHNKDYIYKLSIPQGILDKDKNFTRKSDIGKKDLLTIHSDELVAKELILVIINTLSNSYFLSLQSDNKRVQLGYKRLYSKILEGLTQLNKKEGTTIYKKVLKLLIDKKIMEKGKNYSTEQGKATEYRLTDAFFNEKFTRYNIETQSIRNRINKSTVENLDKLRYNTLALNQLKNLVYLDYMTAEQVEEVLNDAVKDGYTNKKDKKLVKKGKNPKRYSDRSKYVHLEDYLADFQQLHSKLLVPIITGDEAGERVITKFNLTPSLIREKMTMQGEEMVEVDYSCLHPNIAIKLYASDNDDKSQITHDKVADYLGIDRKEAKIEHLSFFNKRVEDMKKSPLWKYYEDKCPGMIKRLTLNKDFHGHKNTSSALFQAETNLMTAVVKELEECGVNCLYVFDAMAVKKVDYDQVVDIMNYVAEEHKIDTTAS